MTGGWWRCRGDGVEVSIAIAAKNHGLGLRILNRKAKSVKLNRAVIVAGKLSNR
jgi:hypothetical protein